MTMQLSPPTNEHETPRIERRPRRLIAVGAGLTAIAPIVVATAILWPRNPDPTEVPTQRTTVPSAAVEATSSPLQSGVAPEPAVPSSSEATEARVRAQAGLPDGNWRRSGDTTADDPLAEPDCHHDRRC